MGVAGPLAEWAVTGAAEAALNRRAAGARRPRAIRRSLPPALLPLFCSFNHAISGWKYSMIALASISRPPVSF